MIRVILRVLFYPALIFACLAFWAWAGHHSQWGPQAAECTMGPEPQCVRWQHSCKLEWDRYYSATDKYLRCRDANKRYHLPRADSRTSAVRDSHDN